MIKPWWGNAQAPGLKRAAATVRRAALALEPPVAERLPVPADQVFSSYLKKEGRGAGSTDRAVLGLAFYGFARNRDAVMTALGDTPAGGGNHLALSLMDAVSDDHSALFPGLVGPLERLRGFRAGRIQAVVEGWETPLADAPEFLAEALAELFSIPGFWLKMGPWETVGEAAAELNAGKFPQAAQLRAREGERERLLNDLSAYGVDARITSRSPWGVVCGGRLPSGAVAKLHAEFQDEGSQLASHLCLPLDEGARVLDLCAGSGGKALAIADASGCRVFLHDSDPARLEKALPRIAKSGLGNLFFTSSPESEAPYDLVLVDAPCSSTGTVRRNPALAWRWREGDIALFAAAQLKILERGASLVKPGGRLVYATCSLLDAENRSVVDSFLAMNPAFSLEPASTPAFDTIPGAFGGSFRLPLNLPAYDGDGFFLAGFSRSK